MTAEKQRLIEDRDLKKNWRKFGPYLTERQWGTVREDYSAKGDAWNFVTHDAARSTAYRWGEEGIGGISDDQQLLCLSVGLWNKKDPIIKERIFGLTGNEGNHAEDCKDQYYYIDSTPTHSYMKMLYKYPQNEFPYKWLVEENKRRGKLDPEFELIDTGIFNENKYFDVFIEYAKADEEDILMRITIENRGTDSAWLNVLPSLWFRNTWAWGYDSYKPELYLDEDNAISINNNVLGDRYLFFDGKPEVLFCENETNTNRLYNSPKQGTFKDGVNDYLVSGNKLAINKTHKGTKSALNYELNIPAGKSRIIQLRLTPKFSTEPFKDFNSVFDQRLKEADEFFRDLQNQIKDEDKKNIQRQAIAGMMWSKQFYYYDVAKWLKGDPALPAPPQERKNGRNKDWTHLTNADIISMPDTWEYPWYAAWDLAFHTIPIAMVDPEFAKHQLLLLTKEWYMHPNGQLPAYEWTFSDVNPPVHGWATWRVYKIDQKLQSGKGDRKFLEEVFHKLLLNFTWWVNKKDHTGSNIFQGGFLGMDNIGVFDRSTQLPTGGYIEQSDGTSWMAMFTLNMMRMALELAKENPTYQSLATKFFEHFLYIAGAITNEGIDLWDEEDEFFYDVLHTPDDKRTPMKIRSMVGLIPLFAVEVLDEDLFNSMPEFTKRLEWFLQNRPDLANLISRWGDKGRKQRHLLSLLRGHRMKSILKTGASSGIGAGVAKALAEEGATVIVNYSSSPEKAETILNEIKAKGGEGITIKADVSNEAEVIGMFQQTIKHYGTVDILVNNAGLQKDARFHDMTLEEWNHVISINLTGQFLCSREAIKEFMRRGIVPERSKSAGKIICMSSVHEVIPWAGHANYSASKGGVMMLMKSIAQEYAPLKIRVNSIGPGAIRTPINHAAWQTPEAYNQLLKLIPAKRIGEVEDIGGAAVWLASDDSEYVNGITLFVDGGMLLYPGFEDNG